MHPELLGQLASQHANEIRTSAPGRRDIRRAARPSPVRDRAGRALVRIGLLLVSEPGDPSTGATAQPIGLRAAAARGR